MRRVLAARLVRWVAVAALAGVAVVAAFVLGVSAITERTDPLETAQSTTSDVVLPPWVPVTHPPRTARSIITVTATEWGFHLRVEHDIVVQSTDPLRQVVQSGSATGRDLDSYLLGGSSYGYYDPGLLSFFAATEPTLDFVVERPTSIVRFGVDLDFATTSDVVSLALEDVGRIASMTALVTTRELTVRGDGFRIRGVVGQPVSQDAHTVAFGGPPARTTVHLDREPGAPEVRYFGSTAADAATRSDPATEEDLLGPFAPLLYLITEGWLVWGLTLLLPWLVLLARRPGTTSPAIVQARGVAAGGLVAYLALSISMQYFAARADRIAAVELIMLAPPLIGATIRHAARRPWWTAPLVSTQFVIAVAALATGLTVAVRSGSTVSYAMAGAAAVLGGGAVAGLFWLLFGRNAAGAGAAIGLTMVGAAVLGTRFLSLSANINAAPMIGLLVLAGLGLTTATLGIAAVQVWRPEKPRVWVAGSVLVALVLFVPVIGLLRDPLEALVGLPELLRLGVVAPLSLIVLNVLLCVVAVAVLRHYGRTGSAFRVPLAWTVGIVLILCQTYGWRPFNWVDLLGAVAALVMFWWVMPPAGLERADRFGAVTVATHTRLVRAETRRRLVQLSAHDVYRGARSRLAAAELKLGDYDRTQRALDDAASPVGKTVDGITVQNALGTSAGSAPWRNAVTAVGISLPVSVLVIAYELLAFTSSDSAISVWPDTVNILEAVRHLTRWLGYALLFGFFYPLLRGRTPVVKALALGLAVLTAELPPVLAALSETAAQTSTLPDVLTAMTIRTGQVLAFCLVLGLLWERRLGQLAGFSWDRIRNIRSMRSMAAPATTIVVAALTALATALAGALVAGILTSSSGSVPADIQPTTTTSPPPSR